MSPELLPERIPGNNLLTFPWETPVKLDGAITIDGIGKTISPLALGTAFYRESDRDRWFGLLDDFVARGGTVVDSARDYGESERVLGQWLESRGAREQVVLVTKGGQGEGHGLPAPDFADTIARELSASLDHLGTSYVDLYLLHRDSPSVPVEEIMVSLNAELSKGRSRAFGASNWQYDRLQAANEYAANSGIVGFSIVSNHLSLATPAGAFYPGLIAVNPDGEKWHERTNIPLMAWSSQARGFFTGAYGPEAAKRREQTQDGFVTKMLEIYGTADNFARLERAKTLGRKKGGFSAVQIALAWLLHKPFPLLAIVGPHTQEELASCFDALRIAISEREMKWLSLRESGQHGAAADG